MKNIAAVLNIPLLAIVFMGFVSRRTPAAAANIALVAGIVFQSYFGIYKGNKLGDVELHWLHVAALNFAFLMVLMYVVRLATPRAEPYEQKYSEDVDITPWRFAKPVGVGVVVMIAIMYIGFAGEFGTVKGTQIKAEFEAIHPPAVDVANGDKD